MAWELGEGPPQDDDFIGPHQWQHENLFNILDSKMHKSVMCYSHFHWKENILLKIKTFCIITSVVDVDVGATAQVPCAWGP